MTTVVGVNVCETNYLSATIQIRNWALAGESRSVIATGVHGVMEAHNSPDFKKIINSADMITPDGMPLVWMLRLKGVKGQTRVYGPTLILHVLEMAAREKIPVGFYGSTDRTLQKLIMHLSDLYPWIQVTYAFSPPFRLLNEKELAIIVEDITASGTRILFVGLGCPKQEKWMAEQKGKSLQSWWEWARRLTSKRAPKARRPLGCRRLGWNGFFD